MSPFDDVLKILKTEPPEINEDYYFIMADEIPIKEEEYIYGSFIIRYKHFID